MTDTSGPPIGTILDGKYRLNKQIGRGGMATIFAAENVDIGKEVAVKVLSHELADSKTVTERFLREARAAAKIKSPYICEVYDMGMVDNRPFIVLELLLGESLYDRLSRERRLSLEDVDTITSHVCKGLTKAHAQKIVHRDLKPENIFLTTTEDGHLLCKLLDFGLAKFYEHHQDPNNARLTKEGALFGTPAYMSPEQARAKHNVDHRADLWALGCIVYEMLTGRTVWDVDQGVAMILAQVATGVIPDPARYRRDLPPGFAAWFARALSRKVETRFQTAEEFGAALSEALGFEPGVTMLDPHGAALVTPAPVALPVPIPVPEFDAPPPPAQPTPREAPPAKTRKRFWPWVAGAALAIGASAAGFFYTTTSGLPKPAENAPYALQLSDGQEQLYQGRFDDARATFQAAFEKSNAKAARSMLGHLEASKEIPTGACALKALGHPRPFDTNKESSKPAVLATPAGTLVVWASADNSSGRTTAYTALVDAALRRVSEPIDVTPAASAVREPELVGVGEKVGLYYWDFGGDAPGVYTSMLDARGRGGAARELLSSDLKGHPFYPALVKNPSGGFIVVYIEATRERVHDLMARQLDDQLTPIGKPLALTGYATPQNGKVQAARPAVGVLNDMLHVAYTLRRPATQELLLLRTPLQVLGQGKSVEPVAAERAPTGENEEQDRFLGQIVELNVGSGKPDLATLKCNTSGCYAAWDNSKASAELAFIGADGKVSWRRQLVDPNTGKYGARPGIALREKDVVAAWFQDDRVLVAPISQSNALSPTSVGRAAAVLQQPQPLLLVTEGSVLVGWRGYESAVPEPFLASVGCP